MLEAGLATITEPRPVGDESRDVSSIDDLCRAIIAAFTEFIAGTGNLATDVQIFAIFEEAQDPGPSANSLRGVIQCLERAA
jgi:hypothetical protein